VWFRIGKSMIQVTAAAATIITTIAVVGTGLSDFR
jgi:hypothetical protein